MGAERFLAEIKTTASLQHPHILPLFDSGEADGFLKPELAAGVGAERFLADIKTTANFQHPHILPSSTQARPMDQCVDVDYTAFDVDLDDQRFLMYAFGSREAGSLIWVRNWLTDWRRRAGEEP